MIVLSFYSLKGYLKGAVKMFLSIVGTTFIIFLAYFLAKDLMVNFENGMIFDFFNNFYVNLFNKLVPGEFSSIDELVNSLGGVFSVLSIILEDISFDGVLSCGHIVGPTLARLTINILLFLILFFLLHFLIKLFSLLINKMINFAGLSFANRMLGLVLGLLKGTVVFAIIFLCLSTLASLNLSEGLTNFVQSGFFSNFIYENYITKIFSFIYHI